VAATLALTLALGAAIAAVDWRVDFYGLFGDARGRSLAVVANERQTKYLLAMSYIPANFDALLVGSSIAGNLDPAEIHGWRMYNAAMAGANITEERLIAENVLRRGHVRLVLVCVNAYLLFSHGRKAGGMEPRDVWSALGSTELVDAYLAALATRLGLAPVRFTPAGAQDLEAPGVVGAAAPGSIRRREDDLDEEALAELDQLLRLARAHGAAVVGFLPPVYAPTLAERRAEHEAFVARVRAHFALGEPILDLNDGALDALAGDPASFIDGVHLRNAAARTVMRELDRRLAR
jgi:hypothetical protein